MAHSARSSKGNNIPNLSISISPIAQAPCISVEREALQSEIQSGEIGVSLPSEALAEESRLRLLTLEGAQDQCQ